MRSRLFPAARLIVTGAAVATALTGATTSRAQSIAPDSVTTVFVSDTIADFGAVGGVAVDQLGYVHIADFRNAVWRLSPDGELIKLADGLYGASGNAIGPRGYLYQSSFYGNYVSRISRTGEVETWAAEGLSGPVGIAAAPDGSLFVVNCSGGYISRVAPDRTVTEFARSDMMACPNGITFDDRGDLYVVNFNNPSVLRVTPDGTVSKLVDVPGAGGNGHVTFMRGALFVTQFRGNQIFRVQRDGTYAPIAGTRAPGTTDGPALEATFTKPNGIGASPTGDALWVNDLTTGPGVGRGINVVSLRKIRLVSLQDVLLAVDPADGPEGIRAAYAAYREARPDEDSSAGAIGLGYQWLTGGRFADALALFELNAESYPSDANAQFHLGEAYRYTGQNERAAAQYRRVLELDPDHPQAGSRLAQVS
ncbi:MAG: tetratricopeptide repeat protein [Gemmatimonadota bacterium]|jgi:sugar lactone lactonase YvrE